MSHTIDQSGNIHRPAGAPGSTGGQFNGRVNQPPSTSLMPPTERAPLTNLLQRRAELIAAGYAPATAGLSTSTSVGSTEGIESWWEEHFRRAEVTDGASYAQMPDDYTPASTSGQALSGRRRTHRIKYEGPGISLRMPSATAIRRFSQENGHQTFDVPVQAEGQNGQTVSGYVRVTQESPGKWTVAALGMPSQVAWKVSESVASVLEARRPSRALRDAGDLLARRRERIASAGTTLTAADNSSWVSAMGYNRAAGEMVITLGQRTYGYRVSEGVFQQVANARSAGKMYNALVKGAPRVAIEQCGTCARWFNVDTGHTCMRHHAPTGVVKPFNDRVRAHILAAASLD